MVAGPAEEFFDAEVQALQEYLNNGGSLMLLIDPRTSPRLGSLLDDWGVTLDDRIVLDTSGTGQLVGLGPATPLVTDYPRPPHHQRLRRWTVVLPPGASGECGGSAQRDGNGPFWKATPRAGPRLSPKQGSWSLTRKRHPPVLTPWELPSAARCRGPQRRPKIQTRPLKRLAWW